MMVVLVVAKMNNYERDLPENVSSVKNESTLSKMAVALDARSCPNALPCQRERLSSAS